MMSSATWDSQDQHMAANQEDDFNQFLDMSGMANIPEGMHFDFQGFQDGGQQMMGHQRESGDALMTDSDGSNMMTRSGAIIQNQGQPISTAASHTSIPALMMGEAGGNEAISNIDAQIQYLQQQKFHQQQRHLEEQRAAYYTTNSSHGHSVPPTPQSLEMTPGSGHFYSQPEQVAQHGAYDRNYQRQLRDEMAFTPLVSPAVTPLDPHFNMENAFTVPGAYFSPLTSPALHAQNDSSSTYDHSTHSNNSPVEMELECAPAGPIATNLDLSKKARKNNAAKARSTKGGVKSSPISKPQRRKVGPSPAIVSQVLNEVDEANNSLGEPSLLPMPATSDASEENASVSPENLTDMPPPPVPARRSTSKSPYIQALGENSKTPMHSPLSEAQPHPATPASLMKLPASKSKRHAASQLQESTATDNIESIESLELPESVSNGPLAPINTSAATLSPRLGPGSGRASAFQALPSPIARSSGISSATQSPQLRPGSSGPSARKTPLLAPRGGRKQSIGSVHVSPALLPRISPSIKPLLPGTPGMSSADSAASQLLMSKSNYQNIIEGNTVPGVTYPSDLSTNLTSKRTSHKIAEQGRRNRINSALQVMAGLLPEHHRVNTGEDSDKKDGKQNSAANASNSKASVVENAIEHMQTLEQENSSLKNELLELKKKLQEMGASPGSATATT